MSIERRKRYSERNGYKPLSEVLVVNTITPALQNALCSCFDRLYSFIRANYGSDSYYYDLQRHIWTRFLDHRERDYVYGKDVISLYLESSRNNWFEKFDIIEEALWFMEDNKPVFYQERPLCFEQLKNDLNNEFERLNIGHRVVDDCITDIVTECEIESVEMTVNHSDNQVKEHLQKAIMLYSQRPEADYRNSIKESISAVESYCRKKTGEITLGRALKKLEDAGIMIHPRLKSAFEQLYAYTNDGDTGIRHALIEGEYVPSHGEALFMLVSCSALINYLEESSSLMSME